MSNHRTPTSGHYEFYTPLPIVAKVLEMYEGVIDTDPASNPPPYHIPARLHYTAADNGLWRPWPGKVYCNPPYGALIPKFLATLQWSLRQGHTAQAIMLLPSATDTIWFHAFCFTAQAICFVRGRQVFITPGAVNPQPPVQGNALVYWGPHLTRFQATFAPLGKVVLL